MSRPSPDLRPAPLRPSTTLRPSETVDSLCFLGTHGEFSVAIKSRKLLVSILVVIAKIFPDRTCSDLLTLPSLLEISATIAPGVRACLREAFRSPGFASSLPRSRSPHALPPWVQVKSSSTRAHKASQILVSICDAFAIAPYEMNTAVPTQVRPYLARPLSRSLARPLARALYGPLYTCRPLSRPYYLDHSKRLFSTPRWPYFTPI